MNKNELVVDERLELVVAPLSESQKIGLRQSIEAKGCVDPIKVWGKIIWDGTECYRICKELNKDYDIKYVEFANIAEAARERIKHHQNRRQMNVVNRIESALDLFEGELAEEAKANQLEGARKGGLAKAGSEEPHSEENNRTWVNSLIAELAETNPKYVSLIRNLRKNAADNVPGAKGKLFELRRGDSSISSLRTPAKPKPSNASNEQQPKATSSQKTLVEQYDDDRWGMEFAFEEMKYESLKDRLDDNEKEVEVIDHDKILDLVTPYCKEDLSYSLVALMVPLLEISYRIGFIRGQHETTEEQARTEFSNRDFCLHSQFRTWLKDQDDELHVKGSPEVA